LVPVPDGPGEEQITEGLTARSFLIKAIFASSPKKKNANLFDTQVGCADYNAVKTSLLLLLF
jgi:hypothetical protein